MSLVMPPNHIAREMEDLLYRPPSAFQVEDDYSIE
ncbi:hypothetical protein QOZ95_003490 [Paenibacillus brasilensis]|uniref:Uncharacterized protein n=1 Tax=Paenibacillus brasilensis TaxID=128574 RepID=A0ABU0L2V6_9BACL|nr:hypothetical protein [Paenibacillus brasilensis]